MAAPPLLTSGVPAFDDLLDGIAIGDTILHQTQRRRTYHGRTRTQRHKGLHVGERRGSIGNGLTASIT